MLADFVNVGSTLLHEGIPLRLAQLRGRFSLKGRGPVA
jgi:hypothetical protein